jgi:hypothetical protein
VVAAAGLALGCLAAGAALCLRWLLDPLPVFLPPPLSAGMVKCPASERTPGTPRGTFWIDRFEVTVGEYREFLLTTGRKMQPGAELWSDPATGPGYLPASSVTLEDARAYARWRGKRLPTSGEWEWAARGPAGFRYPWGDRFDEAYANTAELDLRRPTFVGTFFNGRSHFSGAYDLVGNVWEWTDSPAAHTLERRYVIRGGSFLTPGAEAMDAPPSTDEPAAASDWRAAERGRSESPQSWSKDVGFRCVADQDAVEHDERLLAALSKLGARDPIRVLFDVRIALGELAAPEARDLVARALAINHDRTVRERLESVRAPGLSAGR